MPFASIEGNTFVGEVPHFTLLTLIYGIHLDIHERRLEHDKFMIHNLSNYSKKSDGINNEAQIHWLETEKQRTEAVLRVGNDMVFVS